MTTDTVKKEIAVSFELGGKSVKMGAIERGAHHRLGKPFGALLAARPGHFTGNQPAGPLVVIAVNLNEGDESAECWGCDLTYDYVKINGDYRT